MTHSCWRSRTLFDPENRLSKGDNHRQIILTSTPPPAGRKTGKKCSQFLSSFLLSVPSVLALKIDRENRIADELTFQLCEYSCSAQCGLVPLTALDLPLDPRL
jgi:hypothetical protein